MKLVHLDIFSGIGGFSLAADNVYGKENVEHTFCEIDPFCQEVLKKHWPESRIFGDIRTLTKNSLDDRPHLTSIEGDKRNERNTSTGTGERVHLLTGGFPCQPFSQAGRRRGEEDDRFLWPQMLRVIREFSPLWVIAENVRGLLTIGGGVVFERVCTDLEAAGYEVQPIIIPAVAVGAPHRRDRVWFVAHRRWEHGGEWRDEEMGASATKWSARKTHTERQDKNVADTTSERPNRRTEDRPRQQSSVSREDFQAGEWKRSWYEVALATCNGGMDDGLRKRMDRNPRLKALGNAIVPACAKEILKAIKDV